MTCWTNYHGHCDYCDGQKQIEEYIIKAIELNMLAIGVSSHGPVPFLSDWHMPAFKLKSYLEELESLKHKYKAKIEVYSSLEVDYVPGVMSCIHPSILKANLDYTVGSVHFVDSYENDVPWAIDGAANDFKAGLDVIFQGNMKAATQRFYELQREMIRTAPPTIVGHLDKMKMHNSTFGYFDEREEWYLSEVRQTLELIAEKKLIVEINTKAFLTLGLLYPGPEWFATIKDLGIPITINSDAHHPDKLQSSFVPVAELLMNAGFTHLHTLIGGQWKPVPFSRDGLAL